MKHTFEHGIRLEGHRIWLRMDDTPQGFCSTWEGTSHNHAGYELHILLGGSCRVDVAGGVYGLGRNQALLIAPGQYHCPVSVEGEFARFAMSFTVENGPLLQALQEAVPVCRTCAVTEEAAVVCREILLECAAGERYMADMLRCHMTRVLVCMFRQLKLYSGEHAGKPEKKQTAVITSRDHNDLIDSFFSSHLKQSPKAAELAAMLYVSRRQLNRILQEHYGMNFREKLLRTRMDRAAWLLRHTDLSVGQVAEEVGYGAGSSFFHVFKERYGTTPEVYRAGADRYKEEN